MKIRQIIGIVILVIGIMLLIFGINASQSPTEQVVEGLTGRFTDDTTWLIVGGIAATIGGGLMAFMFRGK